MSFTLILPVKLRRGVRSQEEAGRLCPTPYEGIRNGACPCITGENKAGRAPVRANQMASDKAVKERRLASDKALALLIAPGSRSPELDSRNAIPLWTAGIDGPTST
ncbi:hypothetical protein NDU88_006442 [Pleurodeles waltl]|uniref:Uncharacterized protein n=1 Tax=Pleurodeles waltl TaxID=8319 RepID=A0AAV7N2D7_PLEWA|nr:hypothetical protein NDU88_006442 [Pleurodeles waltl]